MKKNFVLLCSLIVVFFASIPVIGGVVYGGQDLYFHVDRILQITNSLAEGQFPVRIYAESLREYGYASSLFYPELFLYIPAFLHLAQIPITKCINLFLLLINFATFFISYYSFKKITKSKEIGVISATFYLLSTYRLVDMYTRSSIGELLALMFCPLVLCSLEATKNREKNALWLLVIAFSGILQSHVLTFVLIVTFSAIYVLIYAKEFLKVDRILIILKAALMTILLNAWFFFPFLYVLGMNTNASDIKEGIWITGSSIEKLFNLRIIEPLGHAPTGTQSYGIMPTTPGVILLVCALMYPLLHAIEEKNNPMKKQIKYLFVLGCIFLFMTTSLFPWEIISKVDLIKGLVEQFQFLFRFNTIVILAFSVVAGYSVYYLFFENFKKEGVIIICSIICISSLTYLNGFTFYAPVYGDADLIEIADMDMLYLLEGNDIYSVTKPISTERSFEYSNYLKKGSFITFDYSVDVIDGFITVEVPLAYFPVYKVEVNGERCAVKPSEKGLLSFDISALSGAGSVTVDFEEPILFRISNLISLLTFLYIGVRIVLPKINIKR